jgi:signal transduction histidine kinase/ligand-binding sensor domain-containing protein
MLLLSVLCSSPAFAQIVRFYSIPWGEQAPSVVDQAAQDSSGRLWLATREGLAVFDGGRLRYFTFDASDSTSLGGNQLWGVAVDRKQRVWAATSNWGISRFDPETGVFDRFDASQKKKTATLSGNSIPYVFETASGAMLAAVWNSGINVITADSVFVHDARAQPDSSGLAGGNVRFVFEDPDETLWVVTNRAIGYKRKNKDDFVALFRNPDSLRQSNSYFNSIAQVDSTTWVLGGRRNSLWTIDTRAKTITRWKGHPALGTVTALAACGGALWAGTFENGLFRYDLTSKTWEQFAVSKKDAFGLKISAIDALFADRQGQLWIFGPQPFAQVVDQRRLHFDFWSYETHHPALHQVSTMYEDGSFVWIGTETSGLLRRDNRTQRMEKIPVGTEQHIYAIQPDASGNIWIGTAGGLYRLDRSSGKPVVLQSGLPLPKTAVTALEIDEGGFLLAGTQSEGVWKYNVSKNQPGLVEKWLPGAFVWDIHRASDASIWIACWGGGVFVREADGTFNQFHQNAGTMISDAAITLSEYGSRIVAGTWGDGATVFTMFKREPERHLRPGSPLPNGFVYGAAAETEAVWWMITNGGLVRVDLERNETRLFGATDGIVSKIFIVNALHRGESGAFYAGATGGMNVFYPENILFPETGGRIVLSSLEINGKPVAALEPAPENTVRFRPDEVLVRFSAALTDLHEPQTNRVRYRVKEFGETWNVLGSDGSIVFTGLRPGRYTLELEGWRRNADGKQVRRVVHLEMQAPFWKKTWFWLLISGLFTAGVSLLARIYVKSRLAVERTRTRIARDLHDELGGTLSGITNLIAAAGKMLERGNDVKTTRYLSLALEKAQQLQEAMYEVIWAVNPGNDSWQSFLDRIREQLLKSVEGTSISPEFDISGTVPDRDLPLDLRKNLWLMLKELIHNALKHSNATRIQLKWRFEKDSITITLADNGTGFDTTAASSGNGLQNLRVRAEQSAIALEVSSTPETGTLWILKIPHG